MSLGGCLLRLDSWVAAGSRLTLTLGADRSLWLCGEVLRAKNGRVRLEEICGERLGLPEVVAPLQLRQMTWRDPSLWAVRHLPLIAVQPQDARAS